MPSASTQPNPLRVAVGAYSAARRKGDPRLIIQTRRALLHEQMYHAVDRILDATPPSSELERINLANAVARYVRYGEKV